MSQKVTEAIKEALRAMNPRLKGAALTASAKKIARLAEPPSAKGAMGGVQGGMMGTPTRGPLRTELPGTLGRREFMQKAGGGKLAAVPKVGPAAPGTATAKGAMGGWGGTLLRYGLPMLGVHALQQIMGGLQETRMMESQAQQMGGMGQLTGDMAFHQMMMPTAQARMAGAQHMLAQSMGMAPPPVPGEITIGGGGG